MINNPAIWFKHEYILVYTWNILYLVEKKILQAFLKKNQGKSLSWTFLHQPYPFSSVDKFEHGWKQRATSY